MRDKVERNYDLEINARATKLVDNMVDAWDVVASRKQCRIPQIWEEKKWFTDEIRKAVTRKDAAYKKALYEDTEQNWFEI